MAINVEIERNPTENNSNVIRKFTKTVQEAGILRRVRDIRYHSRNASKFVKKKKALKSIENKKQIEKMVRLGKVKPRS